MRSLFTVLVLLLAASVPAAVPAGYQLTWSDEFTGDSLDLSKWEYRNVGVRRGGYNDPSAVSVAGGNLQMSVYWDAVHNRYNSSMIATRSPSAGPGFLQQYGYFETRMLMPTQQGLWSTFWLTSPFMNITASPANPAVNGAEIDVAEYRPYFNALNAAVHWNGYGSGHQVVLKPTTPVGFDPRQWHTFGLLWTADSYKFYADDVLVATITSGISKIPEYILYSVEVADAATAAWVGGNIANAILPDTAYVDYVRAYAVPEPSTMVLITLAAAGLLSRCRNARRV